jgi:MFS family permease
MAESSGDTGGKNILPAVFLSTFFIRLGFGLTLSIYAFYLGSTVETVGLTAAASPLIEASTVLFAGLAADRFGRLPVLKWALVAGAAILLLMSTTRNPVYLAVLSGIFGLASASILAASLAATGDMSLTSRRGMSMGQFDALNLGGWVYGYALGYGLVSVLNGQNDPSRLAMAFWIGGATVLVALALLWWMSRGYVEQGEAKVFDSKRLKEALLRAEILLVVLPWLAIYMLIGAMFTFLGSAATTLNVPLWELGIGVAVGGTVLLFTQPFYGKLSDRFGRTRVMMIGVAGFLGVLAFGGAIAIKGLNLGLIAGLGISAFGALAFGPSSLAALTDESKKVSRGTTMSLYSMTIAGGMAFGLILSSVLFTNMGTNGVVIFFGIVGALLVVFTAIRTFHLKGRAAAVASPVNSESSSGRK